MLNGWKAIAAYLQREERTAMRWAKERGLPVHRTPGPGRGSVYALAAEIDAWLATARELVATPELEPVPEPEPEPEPGNKVEAEPDIETTPPAADPVSPAQQQPGLRAVAGPRRALQAALPAIALAAVALVMVMRIPLFGTVPAASRTHMAAHAPDAEKIADPAAQAAFLQASYDWNLRTRESLMRAVHGYGEVIERDPRAAGAYVGLANSYLLLREDSAMADAQAYPRAEAAARAAVALSPSSAAPHRALAFVDFWSHQDLDAARREFAQALALDPDDPLTHHWYATALSANGEHDAALREIMRARELDPTSTAIIASHGILAYLAGHHDEGLAMLRAIEREQPQTVAPHRSLADIALWAGNASEYLRERMIMDRLRGDDVALEATRRIAAAGPRLAAVEGAMLQRARATATRTGAGWFQLARIASLAGRGDEAADALRRACRQGDAMKVAAPGDLWLSRTLDGTHIQAICGGKSLQ